MSSDESSNLSQSLDSSEEDEFNNIDIDEMQEIMKLTNDQIKKIELYQLYQKQKWFVEVKRLR